MMSILWALLPMSWLHRKEPLLTAPTKRDAPFLEPFNYLLKFPVSGLPRFPNRPLQRERERPISRAFFYIFPSKSPVNWAPPPCSPTGSLWREKLYLQSQLLLPSFISVRVPNKEPSHKKNRVNIWSPSTEPHVDGRPTCSGVWPGSPRGSFATLQSLPQCHAALSAIPSTLAWVDQSPVIQHVSWQSSSGCALHNCYHLPREPG